MKRLLLAVVLILLSSVAGAAQHEATTDAGGFDIRAWVASWWAAEAASGSRPLVKADGTIYDL